MYSETDEDEYKEPVIELEPLNHADGTMNLFDFDRKLQLQIWQAVDKGKLTS